jgi:nicotinate-nucleotide adenylyltransferase
VSRRCLVLLGGSFDPVHNAHVALAGHAVKLLGPDELRIIPAGNPWQKGSLRASAADRVAMLRLAFARQPVPVVIDEQEIRRSAATYTVDTLRVLRAEVGPETSIAFIIGADQLLHLDTWRQWRELFDLAHIVAVSRPGFPADALPPDVAREFRRRAGTPTQLRETPSGLTLLALNLAIDVSATEIRAALARGERPEQLLPAPVLDYIEQHHLYKT